MVLPLNCGVFCYCPSFALVLAVSVSTLARMWSISAASVTLLSDIILQACADLYLYRLLLILCKQKQLLSSKGKNSLKNISNHCFLQCISFTQQNVMNLHHDTPNPNHILLFIRHLSSKPSSSHIFLIIQRPSHKMIFPKDKRTDLTNKPKINKTIKPYSILSLGFMNKNQGNRSREIPEIRQVSNKRINHQNGGNQNISDCKIEHFPSSTFLTSKVFSQSQENSHCNLFPSSTSIDLPVFQDSVFQRPPLLRLENLTNQDEEFVEKKLDRLYNCQFISQDQDQQQTNKARVFVDMKKKIKKLSFGKRQRSTIRNLIEPSDMLRLNPFLEKNLHFSFPTRIFLDSEVIQEGSIYRNKLISQRIDNDIDTDDEQIVTGIKRMHKSLADAVEEQKRQRRWEEEKQRILESL